MLVKRPLLNIISAWSNARNRHLLVLDVIFLPIAVIVAFALRLDAHSFPKYMTAMWLYAVFAPLVKIPVFSTFGVYQRFWQYGSIEEFVLLVGSVTAGVLAEAALLFALVAPAMGIRGIPRSIPIIEWFVTLLAVGFPRFSVRVANAYRNRSLKGSKQKRPAKRVLIMGAGEAGIMVMRELEANPQTGIVPVGFLDDDPNKVGLRIHGYRVLGSREDIPGLVREYGIDQVIVAMPSAPGKEIRAIVELCRRTGVEVKTVPGVYEIISGDVSLDQIRDIKLEDLLRREPIRLDPKPVERLLSNKRVLITGAGGSIGGELARQVWRYHPSELILLGHGENSIFEIYNELMHWTEDSTVLRSRSLKVVIADIRFPERVMEVFEQYRPEIVFHAAAHKHVPLMELNPTEAVTNNVLGTWNLLDASAKTGVERFVLISTDKAVNPTSVMGASKRVAELLVMDVARRVGKPYVAVRFGNVLGSRGSVVLTFQKQIAAGGPITVTDPNIERFFMTIPEAVQLVLHAATLGKGGEVFVLDMGNPVKIVDIARDVIRLAGYSEDEIEIVFTGLRPGEKLSEELFGVGEVPRLVSDKIFVALNDRVTSDDIKRKVTELIEAARKGESEEMILLLKEIVPTYTPTSASS